MTGKVKTVIGVILCLIFVAIVIPKYGEKKESVKFTQAAENTELDGNNSENKTLTQASSQTLEVTGIDISGENLEVGDPFTLTRKNPVDEVTDKEIQPVILQNDKNDNAADKSQKIPKTQKDKPKAEWKLTGVVITGDSKIAVLSRENSTKTLSVGDYFEDKTIIEINENYILYESATGQGRLDLSLQ